MNSDENAALDAVLKDMGDAARNAKASKHRARMQPKAAPAEPETPAEDAGETMSAEDLEKLLANER